MVKIGRGPDAMHIWSKLPPVTPELGYCVWRAISSLYGRFPGPMHLVYAQKCMCTDTFTAKIEG